MPNDTSLPSDDDLVEIIRQTMHEASGFNPSSATVRIVLARIRAPLEARAFREAANEARTCDGAMPPKAVAAHLDGIARQRAGQGDGA